MIVDRLILITARKRSLRRLCFYTCLPVILFTGGRVCIQEGSASSDGEGGWGVLHPGGDSVQGLHPGWSTSRRSASGGVASRGWGWADPHRLLRVTVNERAVRILLECILVHYASKYRSIVGVVNVAAVQTGRMETRGSTYCR